jgi:hypothetical protein
MVKCFPGVPARATGAEAEKCNASSFLIPFINIILNVCFWFYTIMNYIYGINMLDYDFSNPAYQIIVWSITALLCFWINKHIKHSGQAGLFHDYSKD